LEQVAVADEVVEHRPDAYVGCGEDLAGQPGTGFRARQFFDFSPVKPVVTEHRLHRVLCRCGHATTAPAPEGVNADAVYGPGVRAVIRYLSAHQHMLPTIS
jgi:transposase